MASAGTCARSLGNPCKFHQEGKGVGFALCLMRKENPVGRGISQNPSIFICLLWLQGSLRNYFPLEIPSGYCPRTIFEGFSVCKGIHILQDWAPWKDVNLWVLERHLPKEFVTLGFDLKPWTRINYKKLVSTKMVWLNSGLQMGTTAYRVKL